MNPYEITTLIETVVSPTSNSELVYQSSTLLGHINEDPETWGTLCECLDSEVCKFG